MKIVLWTIQLVLAALFLRAGITKLVLSHTEIIANSAWAAETGEWPVRLLGVVEVLGAIGLVLPAATGILPWLTSLAAIGLALDMIGATLVNLRYGETRSAIFTLTLMLLAAFVAMRRFTYPPIGKYVRNPL